MVTYALKSTQASLEGATILSYITSVKINDGSWKGTTFAFILHWNEQVRIYNKQVHTTNQLSNTLKKSMLENAIHLIPDMRAVKAQADQHKTQTGITLQYDEYS